MVVLSDASAVKETISPFVVGAGETVTVTLNVLDPLVPDAGLGMPKLVVVAVRLALLQLFSKFATLMEPKPVARS
jgi:hypothetical protein